MAELPDGFIPEKDVSNAWRKIRPMIEEYLSKAVRESLDE
jgi:hypothetical protein